MGCPKSQPVVETHVACENNKYIPLETTKAQLVRISEGRKPASHPTMATDEKLNELKRWADTWIADKVFCMALRL